MFKKNNNKKGEGEQVCRPDPGAGLSCRSGPGPHSPQPPCCSSNTGECFQLRAPSLTSLLLAHPRSSALLGQLPPILGSLLKGPPPWETSLGHPLKAAQGSAPRPPVQLQRWSFSETGISRFPKVDITSLGFYERPAFIAVSNNQRNRKIFTFTKKKKKSEKRKQHSAFVLRKARGSTCRQQPERPAKLLPPDAQHRSLRPQSSALCTSIRVFRVFLDLLCAPISKT